MVLVLVSVLGIVSTCSFLFALGHHYISNQYFAGLKPFTATEKRKLAAQAVLAYALLATCYFACDWELLASTIRGESGVITSLQIQTLIMGGGVCFPVIYFLLGLLVVKADMIPED